MLFRKDIDPRCAYCARGCWVNQKEIFCKKRGVVSPEYHCRAFRYDGASCRRNTIAVPFATIPFCASRTRR